ncbi:hypothetical protein [Fibrella forsythiae]|uniref:Uncharacterized protein n=1 Tax=Fibrella forsythiae TaxID=2817061 RepID=A0ABS3JJG8_9BACT|nr:hypothetical protein [Fibrella forsythiae]MBO0949588.1 hypothetical protein [Fibrella forsythiae]
MGNRIRLLSLLVVLLSTVSWASPFPADSLQPSAPASGSATRAEINVRVNYTSRAVFSGREFGVREWMSTPSITYYAKSGFYADVSGYYFSQSLPHYELTALSAGYLGIVSSRVTLSGELSRTFLSKASQQNLLPYSGNLSMNYLISPVFSVNTDYYLMFGNATAHRVRFSLSAFASKKMGESSVGLKRISCIPALTAIFGTETSAYNLLQPAITATTSVTAATTAAERRLLRIQQRLQAKKNGATTVTTTAAEASTDAFGLMAIDLSVPVRATFTGFRLGLTNHLVKPVKIYADEDMPTNPIYYADLSLTWLIR